MKIVCSACQHMFQLEESNVPRGVFKIKCPNCERIITAKSIDPEPTPPPQAPPLVHQPQSAAAASTPQAAGLAPIIEAFVKEEVAQAKQDIMDSVRLIISRPSLPNTADEDNDFAPADQRKALICESDQKTADAIASILRRMKYTVEICSVSAEATKKIEGTLYDMITVTESYKDDKAGGAKILQRINGFKAPRRQMFVVLIADGAKTGDPTAAFFKSVDLVVAKPDLTRLETLIVETRKQLNKLYGVFNRLHAERH